MRTEERVRKTRARNTTVLHVRLRPNQLSTHPSGGWVCIDNASMTPTALEKACLRWVLAHAIISLVSFPLVWMSLINSRAFLYSLQVWTSLMFLLTMMIIYHNLKWAYFGQQTASLRVGLSNNTTILWRFLFNRVVTMFTIALSNSSNTTVDINMSFEVGNALETAILM